MIENEKHKKDDSSKKYQIQTNICTKFPSPSVVIIQFYLLIISIVESVSQLVSHVSEAISHIRSRSSSVFTFIRSFFSSIQTFSHGYTDTVFVSDMVPSTFAFRYTVDHDWFWSLELFTVFSSIFSHLHVLLSHFTCWLLSHLSAILITFVVHFIISSALISFFSVRSSETTERSWS